MTELLLGDHISVHEQLRASYEALQVKIDDRREQLYARILNVPMMPCCKGEGEVSMSDPSRTQ